MNNNFLNNRLFFGKKREKWLFIYESDLKIKIQKNEEIKR
jgi:hypothetical protein